MGGQEEFVREGGKKSSRVRLLQWEELRGEQIQKDLTGGGTAGWHQLSVVSIWEGFTA